MLVQPQKISYSEFIEIDKVSDKQLEFIDGVVYAQAAPSVDHQRAVSRLAGEFANYFKGKICEFFVAPFDVVFSTEIEEEANKVQPDISVICDKNGFSDSLYMGVPTLIVEVLFPSTAARDFIQKMNLYMKYGVSEYWIVSPKNKTIEVFIFKDGIYSEPTMYQKDNILRSEAFLNFTVDLRDIFY